MDTMIQVVTLRKIDNNIDTDKAQDIRTTRHNRHTDHSQVGNQLGVLPHGTHTSEYTWQTFDGYKKSYRDDISENGV